MNARADVDTAPFVLAATAGPVRTLTLNRGARFNALSQAMIGALDDALQAAAADPAVRVVVLAAAGRGFCAGHDLAELAAHPDAEWQQGVFAACNRLMMRLTELPQPVIARVHGLATAAGCQLVSMCDLAVASAEARFGLPGVNIGVFCSTPAVGVARNIGRKRTMQMLLTGEAIDAATAQAWGLVNEVVSAGELDTAVARLAALIASKSAAVVTLGKRAFYRQLDRPLAGAYADMAGVMVDNLREPHAAEGIAAFIAKRPPDFSS
jgi:enoyl-CoA hydratase/carnithine racemase